MTDILPTLRTAVMNASAVVPQYGGAALDVADYIDRWNNEPAVFTRRPLPADAPESVCIVNPAASIGDGDGLTSDRPILTHDIAFYGPKGQPGTAEDRTREIERAAHIARAYFHRNRFSVQPTGYSVIDVQASGPTPAPVDDENEVGRLVTVVVRLRRAI